MATTPMTSTKRTLVLFAILLAIVLFFALNRDEPVVTDPIDEILEEMPQAPESASGNDKIKLAFEAFKKYAGNDSEKFEKLCEGGFINEQTEKLKEVADEIVKNRVINYKPLEYALNQDESGITCLSSNERWVLFSALNDDGEEEKIYFCADSTRRMGNFNIDKDKLSCE